MPLVGLTGVFSHPKRLKPKVPSKDAVWYQRVLCPLIETPRKQPSFRKSPPHLPMTDQHPINPPPELIAKWASEFYGAAIAPGEASVAIATQAARWGADQELEACCELTRDNDGYDAALALRADRRPKPPN